MTNSTNPALHQADFSLGYLAAICRELSTPERSRAGRAESVEIAAGLHREMARVVGLSR